MIRLRDTLAFFFFCFLYVPLATAQEANFSENVVRMPYTIGAAEVQLRQNFQIVRPDFVQAVYTLEFDPYTAVNWTATRDGLLFYLGPHPTRASGRSTEPLTLCTDEPLSRDSIRSRQNERCRNRYETNYTLYYGIRNQVEIPQFPLVYEWWIGEGAGGGGGCGCIDVITPFIQIDFLDGLYGNVSGPTLTHRCRATDPVGFGECTGCVMGFQQNKTGTWQTIPASGTPIDCDGETCTNTSWPTYEWAYQEIQCEASTEEAFVRCAYEGFPTTWSTPGALRCAQPCETNSSWEWNVTTPQECNYLNLSAAQLRVGAGGSLQMTHTNLSVLGQVIVEPGDAINFPFDDTAVHNLWQHGKLILGGAWTQRGNTSLSNYNVTFNGTSNGASYLTVLGNSTFTAFNGSNFSNGDVGSAHYYMRFQTASNITIDDIYVSEIGYGSIPAYAVGFYVNTRLPYISRLRLEDAYSGGLLYGQNATYATIDHVYIGNVTNIAQLRGDHNNATDWNITQSALKVFGNNTGLSAIHINSSSTLTSLALGPCNNCTVRNLTTRGGTGGISIISNTTATVTESNFTGTNAIVYGDTNFNKAVTWDTVVANGTSYGTFGVASGNFGFIDSVVYGGTYTYYLFSFYDAIVYNFNTTADFSKLFFIAGFKGKLIAEWPIRINVSDQNGNPISGLTLNVTGQSHYGNYTVTTDASGEVRYLNVTEFVRDPSTSNQSNNYSINLSLHSYTDYNLSVNYSGPNTTVIRLGRVTSGLADYYQPAPVNISGTPFTPFFNLTYNTTNSSTIITLFVSLNAQKVSGGAGTSNIYLRAINDNVTLTTELIRSVSGLNTAGSTGLNIINFTLEGVNQTNHTLELLASVSGPGVVELYNIDVTVLRNYSTHQNQIFNQVTTASFTHSDTSFWPAFNWSVFRPFWSGASVIARFTLSSSANRLAEYYFSDPGGDTDSPIFLRYLSPGSTGTLTGLFTEDEEEKDVNHTVNARINLPGTVSVNGTIFDTSFKDSANNSIGFWFAENLFTNATANETLGAGSHNLANVTYKTKNGTGLFVQYALTIGSDSGAQTPAIIVNATGGVHPRTCSNTKERTLSSSTDIGNVFGYFICANLTPGQVYNLSLWIEVEPGETLEDVDEYLQAFEVNPGGAIGTDLEVSFNFDWMLAAVTVIGLSLGLFAFYFLPGWRRETNHDEERT